MRRLRILLIEDNRDFVYLFSALLELMGHDCVPAYDGAEGLRRARETRPDVVFCDIGLPEMDGFEVARKIREDPALRDICLVALTGYARQHDIHYVADAGFDHHLPKPAEMEDIRRILERIAAISESRQGEKE